MNRSLTLALGILIGVVLTFTLGRQAREFFQAPGDAAVETRASAGADDDDDSAGAAGADDDAGARERVIYTAGHRRVRLNAAELALAGIRVAPLGVAETRPERHAAGVVADSGALRAQQAAAQALAARHAAQRALVDNLHERLDALRALARDGRLGGARESAELATSMQREQVLAVQLAGEVEAAAQALVARWGAPLVAATAPGTDLHAALAAGESALFVVGIPLGAQPPQPAAEVFVSAGQAREKARAAQLIAPAPGTWRGLPGRAWFGVLAGGDLAYGMRLDVWVPGSGRTFRGTLIPQSAIVWHGGRRWYYLALDEFTFERRALGKALPHAAGYLQADTEPGAQAVVIDGAQSLLAEEFRSAIPDEDDD